MYRVDDLLELAKLTREIQREDNVRRDEGPLGVKAIMPWM